ncbi:MAG: vitamin B12 dependent methionine synthase [Anaerolineae bacterium]|nr:vitamin B12 dependent methionine synthase [Anaerolineae bacterium]
MRNQESTTHILNTIPFQPDPAALMRQLRIKESGPYAGDFRAMLGEVVPLARPKALYRVAYVEARNEDDVTVNGVTFTSRVLRVNLEAVHRVFAYIATCGMELDAWAAAFDDMLFSFWADGIKQAALTSARQALLEHLNEHYAPGHTTTMAPGSLPDWPLPQQRPLFDLLGDVQATMGVQLSDSYLMTPNKTISGLRFPTESNFESCQLCPRGNCPGRRAEYDATLYDRKYGVRSKKSSLACGSSLLG